MITKVWVILKGVPTQHFGVLVRRYSGDVWYISKSLKTNVVRVVKTDEVYFSSAQAFASLTKMDVWCIEGDRLVIAKGYRRGNGTLAGVYANGSPIAFRTLFSTRGKAERMLLRQLWREKREITRRLARIDKLLRA